MVFVMSSAVPPDTARAFTIGGLSPDSVIDTVGIPDSTIPSGSNREKSTPSTKVSPANFMGHSTTGMSVANGMNSSPGEGPNDAALDVLSVAVSLAIAHCTADSGTPVASSPRMLAWVSIAALNCFGAEASDASMMAIVFWFAASAMPVDNGAANDADANIPADRPMPVVREPAIAASAFIGPSSAAPNPAVMVATLYMAPCIATPVVNAPLLCAEASIEPCNEPVPLVSAASIVAALNELPENVIPVVTAPLLCAEVSIEPCNEPVPLVSAASIVAVAFIGPKNGMPVVAAPAWVALADILPCVLMPVVSAPLTVAAAYAVDTSCTDVEKEPAAVALANALPVTCTTVVRLLAAVATALLLVANCMFAPSTPELDALPRILPASAAPTGAEARRSMSNHCWMMSDIHHHHSAILPPIVTPGGIRLRG